MDAPARTNLTDWLNGRGERDFEKFRRHHRNGAFPLRMILFVTYSVLAERAYWDHVFPMNIKKGPTPLLPPKKEVQEEIANSGLQHLG